MITAKIIASYCAIPPVGVGELTGYQPSNRIRIPSSTKTIEILEIRFYMKLICAVALRKSTEQSRPQSLPLPLGDRGYSLRA